MPHLERQNNESEWVELPKTKHNRDPESKSKRAEFIHGILLDTDGVREVTDNLGTSCLAKKLGRRKKRFIWETTTTVHSGVATY